MKETILEYWNPKNETVVTDTGFRYLNTDSVIINEVPIKFKDDIDLFEKFYKKNNSLRYCNGSYYKFKDKKWERKYNEWLTREEKKRKSKISKKKKKKKQAPKAEEKKINEKRNLLTAMIQMTLIIIQIKFT